MIEELKQRIIVMNQRILSFPLWVVLGLSGVFRRGYEHGWKEFRESDDPEKLY